MIDTHAKYTVVLDELLKYEPAAQKINDVLGDYPIYEPTSKNEYIPRIVPTREELNQKLLDHYRFREIGFETPGRFIHELGVAMREIMPYYNQLMFTQDQDFNIIYNVDYQRTIDTEREGESTNKTTGSGTTQMQASDTGSNVIDGNVKTVTESNEHSETDSTVQHDAKHVKSQTPQSELSITSKDIDKVNYADEVNWNKDNSVDHAETDGESQGETNTTNKETTNTTGQQQSESSSVNTADESGTTKGSESTLETTKGNFGVVSAQDLVQKYRETILNIEQMIINDDRIKELFMLVY